MKTETFPRIERAEMIEVGAPRKGRPGYRWVQGWHVRYSDNRATMAMRRAEALHASL